MHSALGNLIDRPGHHDRKSIADLDADLPSRHVNGDTSIHEAQAMGDGGRRTRAASGREGVAGTSLPNLDLNIISIDHF